MRTIPIHGRCAHYSDAREEVCTIRCTRECVHYPMHARMCALFDAREDVRMAVFGKNMFLEKCIDKMKILRYLKYKYVYIGLDTVCFRYCVRYCLSCWSYDVHTSVQRHQQYVTCPHSRTTSRGNCESTDRTSIIHSACTVVCQQLVIISCSLSLFFPDMKNIVDCPGIMSCNSHSVLSRRPRTMLPKCLKH